MVEKDIENLLSLYPDEFFPKDGFKLKGQQINIAGRRADIIFTDKYGRTIVLEIKQGVLTRDAAGQITEYYGLLKQENPNQNIELILCANIIPHERRIFLENAGIECKELPSSLIKEIAAKNNYSFFDEYKEGTAKEKISKAKQTKTPLKLTPNVWIFQAIPKRYRLLNALREDHLDMFMVNQHKEEIRNGDVALIWMSGNGAGIYATVEVVSDSTFMLDSSEDKQHFTQENDPAKEKAVLRVKIKITKNLIDKPILRNEIKNTEGLKNISILKQAQGTNFRVTESEWGLIKKKLEEHLQLEQLGLPRTLRSQ